MKALMAAAVLMAGAAGARTSQSIVVAAGAHTSRSDLLVCADPNNLPFSNRAMQGFENKIVELVAKDLGQQVRYVWWAQRRGYMRSTLKEAKCDVWPGVATGVAMAATTRPYYRSTYVFVTRADAPLEHLTLDDPRLRTAAIGVQMIGNDAMNTPPAHAIAERGLIDNVRGYMVYGNYQRSNPADAIIKAVEGKQIDVALVWGPVAGYYGQRSVHRLRIDAVTPAADPRWPMDYDISMGVRRGEQPLVDRLNAILERESHAIDAILRSYHVPLAVPTAAASAYSRSSVPLMAAASPVGEP